MKAVSSHMHFTSPAKQLVEVALAKQLLVHATKGRQFEDETLGARVRKTNVGTHSDGGREQRTWKSFQRGKGRGRHAFRSVGLEREESSKGTVGRWRRKAA